MHIAVVLLWRDVTDGAGTSIAHNVGCGSQGNDLFFNSNVSPSAEQPAYQDLIASGWKVVPAENFHLPKAAPSNPCTNPPNTGPGTTSEPPTDPTTNPPETDPNTPPGPNALPDPDALPDLTIVGFDGTTTTDSLFLIWQTPNVGSTTFVRYGLSPTDLSQSTSTDSTLRVVHQVMVGGLAPQTRYYMQSVSIDAAGRVVESNIISKMTKSP